MLAIIVVLLYAAHCTSESSPKLWGSRVVGKPVGPSDTMSYRCEGKCGALIYTATWMDELTIGNGSCMVNDKVWGSPCQVGKGTIDITVMDVNKQRELEVYSASENALAIFTTYFVPHCQFPQTKTGEVDLKTSFPLSRFVKGQSSFNIDFAVKGADSGSEVLLHVNGNPLCHWVGVKVNNHGSNICNVPWENFVWATSSSNLSVSVDYTQSGVSPEVVECNQSGRVQRPALTHTTGGETFIGSSTCPIISSLESVLGTMMMLAYLGGW